MEQYQIKNLTLSGTVLEVGDCVQDNPGVIIEDAEGNKIPISLSKPEAKVFASHLFENVFFAFDAKVTFPES